MWASRFWADRYWARRYWCKQGAAPPVVTVPLRPVGLGQPHGFSDRPELGGGSW